MAGSIKGITIEFRGDTTKLDKALRQINNETRAIDKELKNVDKALKFNPTSVELWRQKQDLLNRKLKETNEKANLIRETLRKVDSGEIEMSAEDVDKLKRELIETESKAKTFEAQLRQIGNVNLKAASEQFKEMGSKLESAGRAMQGLSTAAAAVAASIGALAVKSGLWADDLNTLSKKYHIGTGELQKYSAAANLVDVDVETIAKSHTKLEKSMASASKGTGANAEAFEKLGVAVTDSNGELRDGDEVWKDTIEALGNVENETERDALAMQLMGKSAAELNPLIEDGGKTYEELSKTLEKYDLNFIDQETLDQANAFNDTIDTIKAIGLVAFQQLGTMLASYFAPALQKVVDYVGRFAKWLTSLDPKILAVVAGVAGFLAILAPLLITLGKISTGIGALISLFGMLTGPVGIVIAILAALVAAGILLYKNWDKIKAKAIEIKTAVVTAFTNLKTNIVNIWNAIKTSATTTWTNIKTAISNAITNTVSAVRTKLSDMKSSISDAWSNIKDKTASAWNSIKEKITKPFQSAKDTISGIISKIKGWFPISVGNIFTNLKLPHFTLNTSSIDLGKLGTIKYPTGINVSWYAQGGIFDGAQVIGVGENGPEAVVPLDKFWKKLDNMQSGETNITININGSNKDPREIAEEVKRVLIRETNQRRLAWQ